MTHIPERMCAGCRKMSPKRSLLRLAATEDGIVVDEKQSIQARGAYICRNEKCIAAARKKKAFSRQFKRNVPDEVYDILLEKCIAE